MDEVVLSAQLSDQFRGPLVASRLPSNSATIATYLTEELGQVANAFARRLEGFRTLEHDHLRVQDVGDLASALPC
jgi:hypothetical protein